MAKSSTCEIRASCEGNNFTGLAKESFAAFTPCAPSLINAIGFLSLSVVERPRYPADKRERRAGHGLGAGEADNRLV